MIVAVKARLGANHSAVRANDQSSETADSLCQRKIRQNICLEYIGQKKHELSIDHKQVVVLARVCRAEI